MGVLIILSGGLFFGAGLCGWGWGVVRAAASGLKASRQDCSDPGTLFWLGFAAAIAVAQLWNFFRPIDATAAVAFWVLGLAGFADYLREQGARLLALRRIRRFAWWMFAAPVLVLLAREATYGPAVLDSGIYHFQSIRWAQEFPVVPGLGNLLGHFAFNQSPFLFTALLDVGPLRGHGYQFVNSLLFAGFICQSAAIIFRAWVSPRGRQPVVWMWLLLLPAVCYEMSNLVGLRRISSPTPDLALALVEAVLILRLVQYAFPDSSPDRGRAWDVFFICTLSALAVTIKLSSVVFAVLVVCAVIAIRLQRSLEETRMRQFAVAFSASAILLFPWMGRGVILSGYPAYPSTFGAMPFDWKVPAERVHHIHNAIVGFARIPGPDWPKAIGTWNWLSEWKSRMWGRADVRIFLLVLSGAVIIGVATYLRRGRWWAEPTIFWLIPIIPSTAALVFWFFTAPDPRFLGILPWMLPAWLLVWAFQGYSGTIARSVHSLGLPGLTLLCGLCSGASGDQSTAWTYSRLGLANVPQAEMEVRTTDSGLKVRVPAHDPRRRSWYAKLPAAPSLNPKLQLRKRKIEDGFRIVSATAPSPDNPQDEAQNDLPMGQ